jgi:hypothetical protein
MKLFEVEIRGTTPLMQHRFPEDALFALLGAKTEKKKIDEQLTPREIADKHAYKSSDGSYYIPTEYVIGAIKHVASDYKQKNSQRKSLKMVATGAIRPQTEAATLLNEEGASITSFEVDVRKATNHQKGAVAVCRPRFDRWKTKMVIQIDDTIVPDKTVLEMLEDAGKRSGIGSFRVAKGGVFGQFQVTSWKEVH